MPFFKQKVEHLPDFRHQQTYYWLCVFLFDNAKIRVTITIDCYIVIKF
jgi:hypothetical protein